MVTAQYLFAYLNIYILVTFYDVFVALILWTMNNRPNNCLCLGGVVFLE